MDLVVLAGSIGQGAPWTWGCPRPLLPLPQGTLIGSIISRFDVEGARCCVVCANGQVESLFRYVSGIPTTHLRVETLKDGVPLGTAGCLKACESRTESETIALCGGSVWLDDDPEWMIEEHRKSGNALSVFCTRQSGWVGAGIENHFRPAGIFFCERSVLEYVSGAGFFDLKEQLVPALQRAGLRVGAIPLRAETCEVNDRATYVRLISHALCDDRIAEHAFTRIAADIWCGRDVEIAPRARIVGPALIGHGCRIDDGAVIVGPTILGDGCHIDRNAWLIRVVAADHLHVRAGVSLTDRILPAIAAQQSMEADTTLASSQSLATAEPVLTPHIDPRPLVRVALSKGASAAALLAGVFIWAFWPSLSGLWSVLGSNPDYGTGQLVPAAALYMITTRRRRLIGLTPRFWWPGAALFGMGLGATIFGRWFTYSSAENVGAVTCALGLTMSLLGRDVFRRLWFPLAMLFLMVPLPHSVHSAVMLPLQGISAQIANTVLETLGIAAVRTGNVLEVAGHQIAVAEACSGLRMALAFLLVTAVLAYLVDRPRWQKIVVLLSSVPIALACNIVRIVFSAYLYSIGQAQLAQGAFHDGAGLVMMPVAVLLVLLEFRLLSNLVVPRLAVAAIVEVCDDRVKRSPLVSGN